MIQAVHALITLCVGVITMAHALRQIHVNVRLGMVGVTVLFHYAWKAASTVAIVLRLICARVKKDGLDMIVLLLYVHKSATMVEYV